MLPLCVSGRELLAHLESMCRLTPEKEARELQPSQELLRQPLLDNSIVIGEKSQSEEQCLSRNKAPNPSGEKTVCIGHGLSISWVAEGWVESSRRETCGVRTYLLSATALSSQC